MMQQLILGLFILTYLAWSVFTFIMAIRGKRTPDMPLLGKLIWYHGNAVAWALVAMAVLSGVIFLARFLTALFYFYVVIP